MVFLERGMKKINMDFSEGELDLIARALLTHGRAVDSFRLRASFDEDAFDCFDAEQDCCDELLRRVREKIGYVFQDGFEGGGL